MFGRFLKCLNLGFSLWVGFLKFIITNNLFTCYSSIHILYFVLSLFWYFFFLNKFIYLFIYFGLHLGLCCCAGFLQLQRAGATLRCGARAFHCGGFSCCGARALGTQASVVAARGLSSCGSRALEHRLSSCGSWALLLHGMWDLPGPGLKPVSPALAGGFLTTAPPGKSLFWYFLS